MGVSCPVPLFVILLSRTNLLCIIHVWTQGQHLHTGVGVKEDFWRRNGAEECPPIGIRHRGWSWGRLRAGFRTICEQVDGRELF